MSFARWVSTMSDEVYRLFLVSAFAGQMTLVSFLPYIGAPLVFVHLCWMCSLYSFEYKWSLQGWSLEYRLDYFERHWCYLAGFGMPSAALSVMFPRFISSGIFALTFPLFIILAIIARPTTHAERRTPQQMAAGKEAYTARTHASSLQHQQQLLADKDARRSSSAGSKSPPAYLAQLPIFRLATWLNWCILTRVQRRNKVAVRRSSAADAHAAATAAAAAATATIRKNAINMPAASTHAQ
jgi:hypothetical protein